MWLRHSYRRDWLYKRAWPYKIAWLYKKKAWLYKSSGKVRSFAISCRFSGLSAMFLLYFRYFLYDFMNRFLFKRFQAMLFSRFVLFVFFSGSLSPRLSQVMVFSILTKHSFQLEMSGSCDWLKNQPLLS